MISDHALCRCRAPALTAAIFEIPCSPSNVALSSATCSPRGKSPQRKRDGYDPMPAGASAHTEHIPRNEERLSQLPILDRQTLGEPWADKHAPAVGLSLQHQHHVVPKPAATQSAAPADMGADVPAYRALSTIPRACCTHGQTSGFASPTQR